MINQEKDIDLIIRFLDLKLDNDELIAFEKRLKEDSSFCEKLTTYTEANTLVNKTHTSLDAALRNEKWNTILQKESLTKPQKKISWKWIGSIAATFLLLFSIWKLKTPSQEFNMNNLIANSWNKEIGLDFNNIRGTVKDSLKQLVYKALNSYKHNDYQSTLNFLNDYKTTNTYYEDVLLLKGLSYYKKGDTDKALKTLDTLYTYPTGKKSKVAQWYLGLIYLEQGKTQAAKQYLIVSRDTIKIKE